MYNCKIPILFKIKKSLITCSNNLSLEPELIANSAGETLLIIAAAGGHIEPMKFLLEGKANVDAACEYGGEPMGGEDWKEG